MIALATSGLTPRLLLDLVVSSLAAALGVTIAFSVLIYCVDRASELRRDARPGAAWAMSIGGLVALLVCAGLVIYGLILVTSKGK